jgi:predicted O-methyltransferase YrrM
MEIIQTLLLLACFAGIFYCVRMLRALHSKVSTSTSKITKSLNEQKTQNQHAYRQLEAFQQLMSLLKFTAPIPPTRGWVASPDLLLTMTEIIRTQKPRLVVELGSGVSTLVIAKAGAKKLISIDNSDEFAAKTRSLLKEHGVRGVEVRVAPLTPHVSGVDWYDTSKLGDLKSIDLLFIDGPPGSNSPDARKPALPELLDRLSPKAVIILDDVNRPAERELAEAFAKALPNHVLTIHHHEKGTAVISPK